jgi:hypothetical protein
LYFSGHNIVKAVFAKLLAITDLSKATDIVVTGESAGGIGSWINAGWFKDQLPKAHTVVVPIAGFYAYAFKYTGPSAHPGHLVDFSPDAWPHHYRLWQSHVDGNCKNAFPDTPWVCMLSNNSRPTIDVPAFVIEAQTDCVQLQAHDDIPPKASWWRLPESAGTAVRSYVRQWKRNMSSNLHSQLRTSDGFFSPSCYIHIEFSKNGPFLTDPESGTEHTYSTAFGKWHAALGSRGAGKGFRLEDSCGLFCGKCHRHEGISTKDDTILV